MTPKISYTYVTLRYVHDVTTREFINVGVVLYAASTKFVGARCLNRSTRLSSLYPGFRQDYFASILSHVQAQIEIINSRLQSDAKSVKAKGIDEIVASVLPKDDSSLQWGESGSGLTSDPKATLTKLFDRLVAKYEEPRVQPAAQEQAAPVDHRLGLMAAKLDEMTRSFKRLEQQYEVVLAVVSSIHQYVASNAMMQPAMRGHGSMSPQSFVGGSRTSGRGAYIDYFGNRGLETANTLVLGSTDNRSLSANRVFGIPEIDPEGTAYGDR